MIEEPAPGQGPADRELQQQWHRQFDELPPAGLDARIRAAARTDAGAAQSLPTPRTAPAGRRWRRFTPLAAAASVALLAVGLVRLMPQQDYSAFPPPTPSQAPRANAPQAPSAKPVASSEVPADSMAAKSPAFADSADSQERSVPVFVPDQPAMPAILPDEAPAKERVIAPPAAAPAVELPRNENAPPTHSAAAATAPESEALSGLRSSGLLTGSSTSITTTAERPAALDASKVVATPPAALLDALRSDAARRTGADVAALRIIDVTPATWRDSSLGCPAAEGVSEAAQAEVPGFIVSIESAGTVLRYHADRESRFELCE